jgi:sulfite reductase beta subunit-like hemoprotein
MNFVAIAENGKLVGFNLLVGGGLSIEHGSYGRYGYPSRAGWSRPLPPPPEYAPAADNRIRSPDMNFVAIAENGKLVGFNLLVGGGLSIEHGNKKT